MLTDTWHTLETVVNRRIRRQLPPATLFWALAIAMPVAVIASTHLWLRTAYSGEVFHLQGFLNQYDYGIYRYRLLGRDALLFVYHQLLRAFHEQPIAMPRDPNATLLFYASYVVIDGLCFSLSNFLLLSLLSDKKRRISDLQLATYLYLTLIQTCAMAVVSPYDQLAYLLILISLLAVTIRRGWIAYPLFGLAAIAGALTRETQFLVTPALFSVALFSTAGLSRRYWTAGLCNLALFSSIYIALRALLPGPGVLSGGWTYGGKWGLESVFFLALLFCINTSLAERAHPDLRPTITLVIFSAPYVLTILISGVLRELRLLVPLLLAQAFVCAQLSGKKANSTSASGLPQRSEKVDTAPNATAEPILDHRNYPEQAPAWRI